MSAEFKLFVYINTACESDQSCVSDEISKAAKYYG